MSNTGTFVTSQWENLRPLKIYVLMDRSNRMRTIKDVMLLKDWKAKQAKQFVESVIKEFDDLVEQLIENQKGQGQAYINVTKIEEQVMLYYFKEALFIENNIVPPEN